VSCHSPRGDQRPVRTPPNPREQTRERAGCTECPNRATCVPGSHYEPPSRNTVRLEPCRATRREATSARSGHPPTPGNKPGDGRVVLNVRAGRSVSPGLNLRRPTGCATRREATGVRPGHPFDLPSLTDFFRLLRPAAPGVPAAVRCGRGGRRCPRQRRPYHSRCPPTHRVRRFPPPCDAVAGAALAPSAPPTPFAPRPTCRVRCFPPPARLPGRCRPPTAPPSPVAPRPTCRVRCPPPARLPGAALAPDSAAPQAPTPEFGNKPQVGVVESTVRAGRSVSGGSSTFAAPRGVPRAERRPASGPDLHSTTH
jgi:hypothetical protein